jgi:predicted MFS family arabinose efflux permease
MTKPKYPTTSLRVMIVLPGACLEGVLATLTPWLIAQKTLGTVWLGLASAGLVLASMLGTLAAPLLERWMGNRRMTVLTAFAVPVALYLAMLFWIDDMSLAAYGFVLLAMAADAASDLGFASRMPLLARLSAQRLEQFSSANWLWAIGGAAIGSIVAGWAMSAKYNLELICAIILLSLITAIGLALLLPRESRIPAHRQPSLAAVFSRRFWTPQAARLALILAAAVLIAGPIDNLLLPGHLTAKQWSADAFGDMLAVTGLGLAVGLWRSQSTLSSQVSVKRGQPMLLGLLGLAGQLGLMLWLPQPWLVLVGLFFCAIIFAPLLPILEAAMLTAAPPAQRTLMLAALSTLLGLADMLGTVLMGALISLSSSTAALAMCFVISLVAALLCYVYYSRSPT